MRLLLPILLLWTVTADAATPQALYSESCADCHTPGISGAPKPGDCSDWLQRIRPGMKLLYLAAINGVPIATRAARGNTLRCAGYH